jgi:hypothetical protein
MLKRFLLSESGDGLAGYLIIAIITALTISLIYVLFFKHTSANLGSGIGNKINQSANSIGSMGGATSAVNNLSNGVGNTNPAQGLNEIAHDFNTYVH